MTGMGLDECIAICVAALTSGSDSLRARIATFERRQRLFSQLFVKQQVGNEQGCREIEVSIEDELAESGEVRVPFRRVTREDLTKLESTRMATRRPIAGTLDQELEEVVRGKVRARFHETAHRLARTEGAQAQALKDELLELWTSSPDGTWVPSSIQVKVSVSKVEFIDEAAATTWLTEQGFNAPRPGYWRHLKAFLRKHLMAGGPVPPNLMRIHVTWVVTGQA